jgi:hypothetical protein
MLKTMMGNCPVLEVLDEPDICHRCHLEVPDQVQDKSGSMDEWIQCEKTLGITLSVLMYQLIRPEHLILTSFARRSSNSSFL